MSQRTTQSQIRAATVLDVSTGVGLYDMTAPMGAIRHSNGTEMIIVLRARKNWRATMTDTTPSTTEHSEQESIGKRIVREWVATLEYGSLPPGKISDLVNRIDAASRAAIATPVDAEGQPYAMEMAVGRDWVLHKNAAERIVARIADVDCLTCKHWQSDAVYAIAVELATEARAATPSLASVVPTGEQIRVALAHAKTLNAETETVFTDNQGTWYGARLDNHPTTPSFDVCQTCLQVDTHEDECPEGYHPLTEDRDGCYACGRPLGSEVHDANSPHFQHRSIRAATPVVVGEGEQAWKCACGWRGTPSQMAVSNTLRTCPQCGGSGGLVLDNASSEVARAANNVVHKFKPQSGDLKCCRICGNFKGDAMHGATPPVTEDNK